MTVAAEDISYIVLSELDGGPYWVCIRRLVNPEWLQVVARFADKDRAEGYAFVENEMLENSEELHGDEWQGQPALKLPESGLVPILRGLTPPELPERKPRPAVVQIPAEAPPALEPPPIKPLPEPVKPQEPAVAVPELVEVVPPATPPAKVQPPAPSKPPPITDTKQRIAKVAEEILNDLPQLLEKYPKGPTIPQLKDWNGERDYDVRCAVDLLVKQGKVQFQKRGDETSQAHHLLPPGTPLPPVTMSDAQQRVFAALEKVSINGVGTVSHRELGVQFGIPSGTIQTLIDGMRRKGFLRVTAVPVGGTTFEIVQQEAAE